MAAHQAPLSLRFSRQEHWSGLPFPSPMHESEKWKWSHSVVSDPQRPHEPQLSRLLCPWDFPGKSTGVGCHCLLLGLQRLIKMHSLFCSFTGESRGFPRANPVPFEAGPVIHVVGLWFSSAVLFYAEWRWCTEWRYRQKRFTVPVFQEQRCSASSLFNLVPSRYDGFVWVLSCCQSGKSDWISMLTKMFSTGASHIDRFLTWSPGVFPEEWITGTCSCVLSVVMS